MKTIRRLEDLRDLAVQFADDLVDGLLPGWVHVFAGHNGVEELPQCDLSHLQEAIRDLKVVGLVVVHVEGSEELAVPADAQLLSTSDAVVDGLPGEFLHLDVVELPEVAEPLDQLGGDAAVKLDIREKHLQHVRAWVAGVEKHELGLLEMIRGEALLDIAA